MEEKNYHRRGRVAKVFGWGDHRMGSKNGEGGISPCIVCPSVGYVPSSSSNSCEPGQKSTRTINDQCPQKESIENVYFFAILIAFSASFP